MIVFNHGKLVLGNAKCSPEKAFLGNDEVGHELRQEGRTDLVSPNLTLLIESLGGENLLDSTSNSKETRDPAHGTNGMTRATSVVKTVGALKHLNVLEPVLESAARQVGRKLGDEKSAEFRVLALTKNLPKVFIGKRSVSSSLELKEMVLGRVEIDSVNTSRALGQVRQDVVTSRGNGKNLVIWAKLQDALIDASIFPGKGIDVFIVELLVLLQLIVVVDTPMVVLVEEGGQRQVGRKVLNGSEKSLRADFGGRSLDGAGQGITLVDGKEVWRLGGICVNSLKNFVRQGRLGKRLLLASNPNVVRNVAEAAVTGVEVENGAVLILEVVTASGLQCDTVKVKPGAPEHTRQGIDVAVNVPSSVVSEGEVGLVLNVEIDNTENT